MAEDYERIFDIENMSDDDLRELVCQELREYPDLDPDLVDVNVQDGAVRLSGRVGTEQELQTIEHIVTDLLGVAEVNNDIIIDEIVRGERAVAADDALAEQAEADPQLGTGAERTEDSAKHLLGDVEAELYGTHDVQEAVQDGLAYEPPDRHIQEGTWSRENH
jgi:hypothetical protein